MRVVRGLRWSWWDPAIFTGGSGGEAQTLIANLTTAGKISPTQFPIFLFYNVIMNTTGESACGTGCALGYHNSQNSPGADVWSSGLGHDKTLRQPWNYGNSSVMAHEVGEWMDDPLGTNRSRVGTHRASRVARITSKSAIPLAAQSFRRSLLSGMSYDLQELAFFSWFYGAPSIGVDGEFSNNATLHLRCRPICF